MVSLCPHLDGGGARLILVVGAVWQILTGASPAADTNAFLQGWFAAQSHLQTWSAEFVQTRTLKALVQPVQASGHLWFKTPDQFRWEMVTPASTIAVRQPKALLVIYPRLKRAERYPLDGPRTGPWRDALALLEAGFPRNRAEFDGRFRLLSISVADEAFEVVMEPRSRAALKMLAQIQMRIRAQNFSLLMTEVQFSDGSKVRTEFHDPVANGLIDPALFDPKLEADVTVTEPVPR